MIFSVYDSNARRFDYYEAPGYAANYGARGTKYRPLTQPPQGGLAGAGGQYVGFAPEALTMSLPSNAVPVGHGSEARGIVADVQRGGYTGEYAGVGAGSFGGLSGLGEGEQPQPPPAVVAAPGVSFGQVVAAACVASIVGVLVQRAMNKKR